MVWSMQSIANLLEVDFFLALQSQHVTYFAGSALYFLEKYFVGYTIVILLWHKPSYVIFRCRNWPGYCRFSTSIIILILTNFMFTCFMCSDMAKIQEGMGDQLSISIQWLTTFLAGFVIGFVREWRLTLLLLVITPLVAITVIISSSVRS